MTPYSQPAFKTHNSNLSVSSNRSDNTLGGSSLNLAPSRSSQEGLIRPGNQDDFNPYLDAANPFGSNSSLPAQASNNQRRYQNDQSQNQGYNSQQQQRSSSHSGYASNSSSARYPPSRG
ncbi:uncharacterized protein L201_000569 [Kwoniella dendrophila CBS 6074]|uniref:Cytoplasmic protein n=1 Tax=Kwoniella dendrophila CBS 6074 TaxID=1295534 RepID=A0AAX4JLJ2_9TREE